MESRDRNETPPVRKKRHSKTPHPKNYSKAESFPFNLQTNANPPRAVLSPSPSRRTRKSDRRFPVEASSSGSTRAKRKQEDIFFKKKMSNRSSTAPADAAGRSLCLIETTKKEETNIDKKGY